MATVEGRRMLLILAVLGLSGAASADLLATACPAPAADFSYFSSAMTADLPNGRTLAATSPCACAAACDDTCTFFTFGENQNQCNLYSIKQSAGFFSLARGTSNFIPGDVSSFFDNQQPVVGVNTPGACRSACSAENGGVNSLKNAACAFMVMKTEVADLTAAGATITSCLLMLVTPPGIIGGIVDKGFDLGFRPNAAPVPKPKTSSIAPPPPSSTSSSKSSSSSTPPPVSTSSTESKSDITSSQSQTMTSPLSSSTTSTWTGQSSSSSVQPTGTSSPDTPGGSKSDNSGLVIGLAVAGSIVGILILLAAGTLLYSKMKRRALDDDIVYTLPWRKSGIFSPSAGVGNNNSTAGNYAATAASSTLKRTSVAASTTIPRAPPSESNFFATQTLYPPKPATQEAFSVEQYLAAGWTMEQIELFKPPIAE